MKKQESYLKVEELEKGKIYKILARNFSVGVWDGEKGFIGIRTKFKCEFLSEEIHWDLDPNFGTVQPLEMIGEVPEHIQIQCGHSDGTYFYNNKELHNFLKNKENE